MTATNPIAYQIFVRRMNDQPWSHYGDCADYAEVKRELRGHIRAMGLYSDVRRQRAR